MSLTPSDLRAAHSRMEPEARALGKALVRGPVPNEAMRLAEIYAYFPGARLANEEEVARLDSDWGEIPGVDQVDPANATQAILEPSAQPPEATPSENFPIPVGPRGGGGVARDSVDVKGRRLLTEGRLRVTRVDPELGLIVAKCRGDSGEEYDLGYDPKRHEWRCTCPARRNCAHLVGLKLVVIRWERERP